MNEEKKKYYSRILFKTGVLIFTLVLLYLAYKFAMFYVPFIIAFLIATMIEPLIKFFMNKCKMKRKASATISLILVVVIIGSLLAVLISAIISESKVLLNNLNSSMDGVYSWGMELINNFTSGEIVIPQDWISTVQDSLGSIINTRKCTCRNCCVCFMACMVCYKTILRAKICKQTNGNASNIYITWNVYRI